MRRRIPNARRALRAPVKITGLAESKKTVKKIMGDLRMRRQVEDLIEIRCAVDEAIHNGIGEYIRDVVD
jgi:hypothetical protein